MAGKKVAKVQDNDNQANKVKVSIPAPNYQIAAFTIRGDAIYMQNKFSNKAQQEMRDKQAAGQQSNKGGKRKAKDFKQCYEQAMYRTKEGWHGIPASAFRNAMISACRTVEFKMTHAKLAVFAIADGNDAKEGTPLVKITKGKPHYSEMPVRLDCGSCDIRARPQWDAGWEAVVRLRFDADMFSLADITNLLARAGAQVGVGEGRPDSKKSAGLGFGTFELVQSKTEGAK
jgi:hypothetical protein